MQRQPYPSQGGFLGGRVLGHDLWFPSLTQPALQHAIQAFRDYLGILGQRNQGCQRIQRIRRAVYAFGERSRLRLTAL